MLAAHGKHRAAGDGTRGVSSKDGTDRLGQGESNWEACLSKSIHRRAVPSSMGKKQTQPGGWQQAEGCRQSLHCLLVSCCYCLLISCLGQGQSQADVLSRQQCHACMTVSRALRVGAEAAGFLHPILSLQGLCTVGKTTVVPPLCTSPLYPRALVTSWRATFS